MFVSVSMERHGGLIVLPGVKWIAWWRDLSWEGIGEYYVWYLVIVVIFIELGVAKSRGGGKSHKGWENNFHWAEMTPLETMV